MGRWTLGHAMGATDSERDDMMLPMYIKSLLAPKDTETETTDLKFYGNPRHQARPSGTRTRPPTSRSDRGAGYASKGRGRERPHRRQDSGADVERTKHDGLITAECCFTGGSSTPIITGSAS